MLTIGHRFGNVKIRRPPAKGTKMLIGKNAFVAVLMDNEVRRWFERVVFYIGGSLGFCGENRLACFKTGKGKRALLKRSYIVRFHSREGALAFLKL